MTLLSAGSSNLLSRVPQASLELSQGQLNLDAITQSFSSQVTEASLLAGMVAGGLVGRALRVAGIPVLGRFGSFALSLSGEAAAFTGTGRLVRGQGFEGFGQDFLHSAISLGSLRVAGIVSAGQSQIFQRALNSSAIVAGNQIAAALHMIDRPQGTFADQFAQALVMDVQSSVSRSLIDFALPGLGHLERSLDQRASVQVQGRVFHNRFTLHHLPRIAAAGAVLLHSAKGWTQPLHGGAPAHSDTLHRVLHGLATGGFTFSGLAVGALPGLLYPILKGKYKAYAALPIALGAGILAARLGTDFSSLREAAGNIAFLGSALVTGFAHEIWLRRRVNDHERIHFWQHEVPRDQYVRTRSVEADAETYRRLREAPPVEINPEDASWSRVSLSRNPETGEILRDVDGYPATFVRFVHDASPKSEGFLKGNYLYNRIFHGTRVTAFLEGFVSTLPLAGLYRRFNRVPGRTIRDFLVQKFGIAYPERFNWSALEKDSGSFNDFFTRPLVTPPEGLEVMPGQTFHDGVLDVVARGNLLDTGIRLAGKGPMYKEGRGDAMLPLREILGRAATRFEGSAQTLIATYLSPRHWHQTLSPVSGRVVDIEVIEGKLHSVDPGIRHIPSDPNFGGRPASYFQSENSRVVVTIDTPEYGPVAVVMTAAALVSTSRIFPRVGEQVRVGELLHEYRWGSHNTLVMRSDKIALAPGLVPGRQVYVRGTKPEGEDGIEWLFVPRNRPR